MVKVEEEVARVEVEKWLEYKRVTVKKKDAFSEQVQSLVEYIRDGVLTLDNENFVFKLNLLFPLGNNGQIKDLSFKPRLKLKDVSLQSKGVSAQDANGRVTAIVAALTDQPKAIINEMDIEDANVAQAIAIFFV